jgi:hypothetical protein
VKYLSLVIIILLSPVGVYSASLDIAPGKVLHLSLPSEHWTISSVPPEFLVDEMAGHLNDGMLKMARQAGIEDRRGAALHLLSQNELFVYQAATGAHMQIDFSRLRDGESVPSRKTVEVSAEYSGQALVNEDDVDLDNFEVVAFDLPGTSATFRLSAEYDKHGRRYNFVGLIGYADPYWVYFYYTEPSSADSDTEEIDSLMSSISIEDHD